ncbi:MAG: ribbon-helix-helix, copG family protein [Holophagaceae bacterium]|nr:ribbon-helix-helix, copG family protein [Holophagaceae bacterium]
MPTYIATVTPKEGGFLATFPDFPGLEAEGPSLDLVRIEAQGALEEHLATSFDETNRQAPHSLDEISAQAPGAILLALGVQLPKSKAVRINITLQEDLLHAVDRSAAAHGMSRSRFLAKAVESLVTGRGHGGIKLLLKDEVLAAVDKAAQAHNMDQSTFLAGLVEVGLGLKKGHCKGHGHHGAK